MNRLTLAAVLIARGDNRLKRCIPLCSRLIRICKSSTWSALSMVNSVHDAFMIHTGGSVCVDWQQLTDFHSISTFTVLEPHAQFSVVVIVVSVSKHFTWRSAWRQSEGVGVRRCRKRSRRVAAGGQKSSGGEQTVEWAYSMQKKDIYIYTKRTLVHASLFFFNLRVWNELQNVPAVGGPEDSGELNEPQDCTGAHI